MTDQIQSRAPSASSQQFGEPAQRRSFDVVVSRGGLVESRHRVHVAVVSADSQLLIAARDPHVTTWWRSCAKPFQVMPLLQSGQFDALGWGVDELALACASHGGEPEHVALAERMLHRLGLDHTALACGPHEPLSTRGAELLRATSLAPSRLHNNCSGKHAAMLARAVAEGWPTETYADHEHGVQRGAHTAVSAWSGMPTAHIARGVDGCGVTVFGQPISHMAFAYARLVAAAARGDDAPARVVQAMTTRAALVGGTDRFDTVLMDACGGAVVCKVGAEGVHTLGLVGRGIGIALKVEDGSARAQYLAVLSVLEALDALPAAPPTLLDELACRSIRNTRGDVVGASRTSDAPLGAIA
ncbi:MAG: asparaginase [Gemmatimonadaceae bacterium]|nr:asparaginase [Gemmatimonadaceae bacterium]